MIKKCELKLLDKMMLMLLVLVAFTMIVPASSVIEDSTLNLNDGWPITFEIQSTYETMIYDCVVVDLEGDGNLDVIAPYSFSKTESYIDAYEYDGSQKTDANFPILIQGNVDSEVSVGDLNQDGVMEIVVNARTYDGSEYHAATYVFEYDGAGYVEAWHFEESMKCGAVHNPILGDIDGDGDLEIIVASHRYDNGWKGVVYAWHHNGTQVSGWPVTNNHWGPFICPALGDIDNDDKLEVVAGSWDYYVYAWNDDGSLVSGNWPVLIGDVITYQSPQIGDLDGDGISEVIQIGNNNGHIYIIDNGGTLIREIIPDNEGIGYTPALGDIDSDGDLEIFFRKHGYNYSLYGYHHDGSLLEGNWPVDLRCSGGVRSTVLIGDVDDDGSSDLICVAKNSSENELRVFAFHADGTLIDGWPYVRSNVNNVFSSGSLIDVDADGDLEIAFTSAYLLLPGSPGPSFLTIDMLELTTSYDSRTMEWPMFQHDARHAGLYIPIFVADAHGPYEAEVGEEIQFMGSVTGGQEPYTYQWDFGNGDVSDVQNPRYNYSATGVYTVTLTVVDNASSVAYDETTATINESSSSYNLSIAAITGGFGVSVVIENHGAVDVAGAEYEICVEGGLFGLINKVVNGTIDVKANDSEQVTTGLFLGFGGIDITVKAADEEKTEKGMQIIVFTVIP